MHTDKRLMLFEDIFWTFKTELSSIVSQGRIEPAWLWGKKKERNWDWRERSQMFFGFFVLHSKFAIFHIIEDSMVNIYVFAACLTMNNSVNSESS